MSNIQGVLGSSNIHEGSESTMRKLHEEAEKLAAFEYPATRTVGFVGDSGVGKSPLIRDCTADSNRQKQFAQFAP
jgi:putative ribosome biogenesis GTPase RsgA